ncbi:MAG: DUF3575 domain-containing protein, partial [Muribaculaceae bacterium]|nr:DUF3575 domain-containing protein [Muribaculaceae bacterium]
MKHTIPVILSLFSILTPALSHAAEKTDTVTVRFRQGKHILDYSLPGNREEIEYIDSLAALNSHLFKDIRIVGAASPEGSVSLNNRLSDNRAEKIFSLFKKNISFDDSITSVTYIGRDWNGLLLLAQKDKDLPYKAETIELLSHIVENLNKEGAEKEDDHYLESLKNLKGGIPYSYLYSNIFPYLRTSTVYFDYSFLPELPEEISIPYLNIVGINPSTDFIPFTPRYVNEKTKKNFYMALKTNMLYDALALPCLSAEFYLGKNFSAVANWTYGWWDTDRTHRYWRAYGGDVAVRWWFGKKALEKPLTGHHIGVYGGIFTYDFEFGGTGYMGGLPHETLWNRSLRMAGIE